MPESLGKRGARRPPRPWLTASHPIATGYSAASSLAAALCFSVLRISSPFQGGRAGLRRARFAVPGFAPKWMAPGHEPLGERRVGPVQRAVEVPAPSEQLPGLLRPESQPVGVGLPVLLRPDDSVCCELRDRGKVRVSSSRFLNASPCCREPAGTGPSRRRLTVTCLQTWAFGSSRERAHSPAAGEAQHTAERVRARECFDNCEPSPAMRQ